MRRLTRLLALASAAAIGCGSDADSPGADAGPDAEIDPGPFSATAGERCVPEERVGIVEITSGEVRAQLFDRVDPQFAAPALSDGACAFYEYRPEAPCDGCDVGQLCDLEGRCAAAPRRDTSARVTLRDGAGEQTFEADPELGFLGGSITLAGPGYTVEVLAFGQTITLDTPLETPAPLDSFTSSLIGSSETPEGIEASWTPLAGDTELFTLIPINHHASGAFTECAIPASAGSLSVSGPMLEPLAVITGLEFQRFEHIRTAAAQTSRGCVEIRFAETQAFGLGAL